MKNFVNMAPKKSKGAGNGLMKGITKAVGDTIQSQNLEAQKVAEDFAKGWPDEYDTDKIEAAIIFGVAVGHTASCLNAARLALAKSEGGVPYCEILLRLYRDNVIPEVEALMAKVKEYDR